MNAHLEIMSWEIHIATSVFSFIQSNGVSLYPKWLWIDACCVGLQGHLEQLSVSVPRRISTGWNYTNLFWSCKRLPYCYHNFLPANSIFWNFILWIFLIVCLACVFKIIQTSSSWYKQKTERSIEYFSSEVMAACVESKTIASRHSLSIEKNLGCKFLGKWSQRHYILKINLSQFLFQHGSWSMQSESYGKHI